MPDDDKMDVEITAEGDKVTIRATGPYTRIDPITDQELLDIEAFVQRQEGLSVKGLGAVYLRKLLDEVRHRHCRSCGATLSTYCDRCSRLWSS